ncbi:MAG: UDP-N-acetylglucosamine pyrophosphorylase [Actinobacteria bacterium HGW-Actinobacteria-10]|nr:MAG: UDP-N-acetylglucosamine pyrophosphorylase [Actinobacteria bacterium HGW-Actinobacteria-10]
MELRPRGYDKVVRLTEKGVKVPNPLTLDIGDDVDVDRISGNGVTIAAGCRIHGAKTVISAGCTLGAEGPVTLVDCRLGPGVDLKGGYFKQSVFLEKANMGLGAQVREGCLLEEEANGAHCVGLKQTILFPFVTLGSLINFCDCLMAGGTSRKDHSEVGSSYIHFNYTPDGDKTTASLFGDVARGVMLDRPPIFLGGQGGAVGPVRLGYGTVVAAGSVLRQDVLDDGKLVFVEPLPGLERERRSQTYKDLRRVVRNNVIYLANLSALEQWYGKVRRAFFARQELGDLVHEGALDMLRMAREERIKHLKAMAEKVTEATPECIEFKERVDAVCSLFDEDPGDDGNGFVEAFHSVADLDDYLGTVLAMSPELRTSGTQWLEGIVESFRGKTNVILSSMDLFEDHR